MIKKLFLVGLILLTACSSSDEEILIEPTVNTVGIRPIPPQLGAGPSDGVVFLGSYRSNDFRIKNRGFELSTNNFSTSPLDLSLNSGTEASSNTVEFSLIYENLQLGNEYFYRAYAVTFDDEVYYGNVLSFIFE